MAIYLKKNICLTNLEKNTAISENKSTKNIDRFDNISDLYNRYYKNIKEYADLLCYHEITDNDDKLLCLFLDIDININNLLEPIEQLVQTYNVQKNILIEEDVLISDLYLLEQLIENFIKYLYYQNNNIIKLIHVKNKEKLEINISIDKFLMLCYENIAITKNTASEKYSYHVYFNNILFKEKDIKNVIKPLIKFFIKHEKHNPFIEYIDTQIYKQNLSLRIIYTKKNNANEDSCDYHYPLKTKIINNELKIIQEKIRIRQNNLEYYFFSSNILTIENKNFIYIISSENEESTSISDEENTDITTVYFDINSANRYFLTLKKIIKMILPMNKLAYLESINHISNLHIFQSEELYETYISKNQELLIDFDYTVHKCIFCKKPSHKNKHYIIAKFFGITVFKKGNIHNCKPMSFSYLVLNERKICEYIFKENIVKRTLNNEIIYFTNTLGWMLIPEDDYTHLKNLISSYTHFFRSEEVNVIETMTENKLKENFKALTKTIDPVNTMYEYYFKFKNGILDLKTQNFISFAQSKHIYLLNGVNYDYKHYSQFNKEEMDRYEYLQTIIDQIIPPKINNEPNYYRAIFEANVSSSLALCPKGVITVFNGQTSAGKTTIKLLIISSLTDKDNYADIPISTYSNIIDPSKPNPWLGQIQSKRVSFASESSFTDKINTQTVKHLTEHKILCRRLWINETGQINSLSQFIDTNFDLEFDHEDPAAYRRWAVIKFTSFFKKPEDENLVLKIDFTDNEYKHNKTLNVDILNNKYSLAFFNLMHIWFLKYHSIQLQMKHTAEISPFCLVNECIKNMSFTGNIVNIKYIKETKQKNYTTIHRQSGKKNTKDLLGMNKKYFHTYFNKFLQHKKIEYDLDKIINEIKYQSQLKILIPIVLIDDIDEKYLINVTSMYKKFNKYENKEFDFTYYEKNKYIFEMNHDNDDDKIDESISSMFK